MAKPAWMDEKKDEKKGAKGGKGKAPPFGGKGKAPPFVKGGGKAGAKGKGGARGC